MFWKSRKRKEEDALRRDIDEIEKLVTITLQKQDDRIKALKKKSNRTRPKKKAPNVQETYLAQAIKEQTILHVKLIDGTAWRVTIVGFDTYAVLVRLDGQPEAAPRLLFKHSIVSIHP